MSPRRLLLVRLLEFTDLVVVFASLLATIGATGGTFDLRAQRALLDTPITVQNLLLPAAYLVLWHAVLSACGLYGSYRLAPASQELRDLALASSLAVLPLYAAGQMLLPLQQIDLLFVAMFWTLAFCGLIAERRVLRALARVVRRLGRNLRLVAIVGEAPAARDMARNLGQQAELGYRIAEVIDLPSTGFSDVDAALARLDATLDRQPIDEVLLALAFDRPQPLLAGLIDLCGEQGILVRVLPTLAGRSRVRTAVETFVGQPVVTIASGPANALSLAIKRAVDLSGAIVGLVLFTPLLLLIAVAVYLDSPGPVIFRQERVGLNRRRFHAYKFRTMVCGAEHMQADLERLNEAQGPVFKIKADPRITRLGRWLRQSSFDELPQLVNVLKGEMSLVGPRPLPIRDVSRIDVRWHKRRFSVKPGITCLWQVKSREPKFDEWIRADIEYIDNWSLALDFKILALTVPAVLSRQGAH